MTTLAVVLIAVATTLAVTLGHREPQANTMFPSADPGRISRSQMMAEYAQIAPFDSSATPATIDELASTVCMKLQEGQSTDDLITSATQVYKAQATQVIQLFVSYDCPAYLKEFK
jgi:fatty acid-binding protein DegV